MVKTCFHPYLPALVNNLEKWLSRMSQDGWKLCEVKKWTFVFRECEPKEREYFVYSDLEKKTWITGDVLAAQAAYEKKAEKISGHGLFVFEVDSSKKDAGFDEIVQLRNKAYKKYYLGLSIFFLICLLAALIGLFFQFYVAALAVCIVLFLMFLYLFVSFLMICAGNKHT